MKENKGEQPEQERAKCEACEGTGEDQCFGLKCLRCDGTGIEPAQAKMKEKDWKEKFEYWLINNLQFTSKVHRIIDHVERYIIPAAQPSKVQEKEIEEKEWKIVLNFFQGEYTLNPRTTIEEVIRELMQTYTLIKK